MSAGHDRVRVVSARPQSVRVLGKRYRVEWAESFPATGDGGVQIGGHTLSDQTLRVLDRLPDDGARETLLHEVLHALDHALALDLDEGQITRLAAGLFALGQGDPTATRWMLGL